MSAVDEQSTIGDVDLHLTAGGRVAVYEVPFPTTYEARNRPTWLDIPLGAIERIGAAHHD